MCLLHTHPWSLWALHVSGTTSCTSYEIAKNSFLIVVQPSTVDNFLVDNKRLKTKNQLEGVQKWQDFQTQQVVGWEKTGATCRDFLV